MHAGWMKHVRQYMKAESEIPASLLTGMSVKKMLEVHQYTKFLALKNIHKDNIVAIANVQPLELSGITKTYLPFQVFLTLFGQ
jgi:hypothetical protein